MMEDETSEGTSTYIATHHEPVQYRTTRTHTEDQQDRWRMKVMCNSTRAEDQQDRWRMKVVCSSMHAEDQG
jgi:hypothetical protein